MQVERISALYHRYIEHMFAHSARVNQSGFRPTAALRVLFGISVMAFTAAIIHSLYSNPQPAAEQLSNASQSTPAVTTPSPVPTVASGKSSDTQSTTSSDSSSQSTQSTTVTVNGQNVSLPENGSVHKTIDNGDSSTSIDYSASRDSNNVSTNLSVQSSSSSSSADDGQ